MAQLLCRSSRRSMIRRLAQLGEMQQPVEPLKITVAFVSPDKKVVRTMILGGDDRSWQQAVGNHGKPQS